MEYYYTLALERAVYWSMAAADQRIEVAARSRTGEGRRGHESVGRFSMSSCWVVVVVVTVEVRCRLMIPINQ